MQRPERMGVEPIPRLILSFALPSITGMLANALYNIVDRIFVGRLVGPGALAAISICFPFMLFLMALSLLFGTGAAPLMTLALGEKNFPRAERVLGGAMSTVLAAALCIALAGHLSLDGLLRFSGAGETLLPSAREYMRIILWGVPFSVIALALNFCIRAEGHPTFAMGTQILGALCNIALDALFVGVLSMGIAGAALGTVISQALSAFWVASFYIRRMGVLRFRAASLVPRPVLLARIFSLGLSPCLSELSFTLFFVLFNHALRFHGGDIAVSAMGAFMGWDSLLFLPVIGVAEAMQTIFAYNQGARLFGRVLDALKWALATASGYFFLSAVTVYFFAEEMLRLFTTDEDLLRTAILGARISYAAVQFVGIALIVTSFFQGLGRAGTCLTLSLARQFVFLIPSILILPRFFGLTGVWFCFPAVDAASGLFALFLLLREYNRSKLAEYDGRSFWARR
ncbi:MAG: MATE family efflux transporter [Synergistaceae bacterium]|jgi:putative MATE family efflux protein|nr:MATE family efflux transporter [Synergistaceae bacterium]